MPFRGQKWPCRTEWVKEEVSDDRELQNFGNGIFGTWSSPSWNEGGITEINTELSLNVHEYLTH